MPLKKRYLKTRDISKVTFRLPAEAAPAADHVHLVGEFNGWDPDATPMTRLKTGDFKAEIDLAPGQDYQFRYLIDHLTWENDWEADDYRPNGLDGQENSVVVV